MSEMLPRERVLSALRHQQPDRVPLDFWAVPEIWKKFEQNMHTSDKEAILQRLGVDVREVAPDYIGPAMPVFADGSFLEPKGTHRKIVHNQFGSYEEYASFPLGNAQSEADLDGFNWPQAEWWDIEHLTDKIGNLHERYYIKIETGGLFELAWALRGYERFMMDMITSPDIVHGIMSRITNFYCAFIDRVLQVCEEKIDMVYTYDDIAGQMNLLVSPSMWEKYIKPYHVQLNRAIKNHGKTIMYHSCGAVLPMIERLIQLPVDVLNPLQPLAKGMDIEVIKERFGSEISFHGAIDIQHLLPHGTREELLAETERRIRILGANGGYILASAHYIQADTPLEQIFALYDFARTYRY
jgi:uroporphyrinogen decarboxylase